MLYSCGMESDLTDLYWKYMLKLYRELTSNRWNRIDVDPRNPYRWNVYSTVCRSILPFIENTFASGLDTENSSRLKNDYFNICLNIISNLIGSRFIDARSMENMRDKSIIQLLNSVTLVLSTIPVENLHVRFLNFTLLDIRWSTLSLTKWSMY